MTSQVHSSMVAAMELERLDSEIEKTRKQFYSAVLGKKRKVKRTWLEISALTNSHLLQILPYRAMLGHVAKLAEERDKVIGEILAKTPEEQENTENSGDETDCRTSGTKSYNDKASPISTMEKSDSSFYSPYSRDEAVQTEESSFPSQT